MISINNATNDSVLKIIVDDNIYRFIGELNHEMEFIPITTGEHIVSLEYDANKEVRSSFAVNPATEAQADDNPTQQTYDPSITEAEVQKPTIVNLNEMQETEGISISKDWLVIKNHEQEIVDKELSLYDFNLGLRYQTLPNATHNPVGPYDTEIILENHPVKKIFFKDLISKGNSQVELRIDDLTNNKEKSGISSKQFYVIDPTSLNFTKAYVTVTAKGESLRKCKDWNYTTQTCFGTWEYIMDLTPGQNYTFLLTPEDPAYNETTHNADNCYNEYSGAACTGTQVTAISANGGGTYSFNKVSGTPIRVSFSNEADTIGEIVGCTVYVDGYDSEGNTWTLQLGNWSTATWDSAGSGQTAPSPEGTISWNCLSHFSSNNDDESLFDDFAVRIATNDRSRTASAYIDHVYVTINFSKPDTKAPYYSGIVASPSSPATYSPTGSYQFNTTWQDNEGVNTTWIEHNFTGTMQNDSVTGNSGNTYYYNYGPIAAGNYKWKMHSNDTAGNINNSMPWQTYTINKSSSQVNLLLNGTDDNFTINNSGSANITGILVTGQGNITIYEQGIQIANGPSPQTSIRSYTTPGNYNITLLYQATQNYTSNKETHFVIVQDTIPPGLVTNLNETKNGTSWILWNWSNPSDADFDHVEIWINGTFETNTTAEYYNKSSLLSDKSYEIQIRSVDNRSPANKGYFVNDTATTQSSADVTPPAITNVQNTSITDISATITWDTDEPATSVVKYGTSPGSYTNTTINLSTTLSHVVQLTGLLSSTTYYYVVNSSDAAGNSNQSIEYSFTTLPDETSPYYSDIVADPASPATYSPSGTYQFNTTWQDNEGVNTTWIEHNFTGTMQNDSVTGNSGNTYYYNYGPIAAGNYKWKMHSNDTAGNINNSMPWQNYKVNKSNSQVNLLLNGTDGDYSINESQSVNITGILVTGQGNISLYRNGTLINQGLSPLTNITTYNAPSTWNITVVYEATQNYTSTQEYHILTVNDTRAPWISLVDPPNDGTDDDGDVIFTFNVNDTSDVQNCSLYINDTYNQEKEILTKGENTFTVNNLGNDNYTWYVNCSDYADHTNVSETWNFTVEISEYYPSLTPITCSDNSGGCTASNLNNTPETWEEHGTLEKGAGQTNYVYINFTQPNIRAGSTIHWMYIYYDKYQDTTEGFLTLEWLNESTWLTICNTNYASGGVQVHDPVNCTLDNTSYPSLNQLNNGLELRAEFYYSGTAAGKQYGTDEAYINLKYTEDVTPPTVELAGPNAHHSPGEVNFTYIPSDANLVNCTLYGDFNGTWGSNETDPAVVSGEKENFLINLSEGYYTWNVYCCDIAENCAFDEIGGPSNDGNYTVNITNPDLVVSQIQFNITPSQTREGMNITINATILNQGNVNATETFKVQFFIGDPDAGGTQINGNRTISGLDVNENKTVNVTWIVDRGGPRNIYVIVDPPLATNGSVKETREDNNKNNKTLQVPAYNYFYGNVKGNIYLSTNESYLFYYYANLTNTSGNILVTDEESSISFGSLQALGRDTSNNPAPNDFNDTDEALNMTDYNDSIRGIYTLDTDTPIATTSMTLYKRTINNIPIINSTNTSNFITGILWDTADGGTQYTGTQDLLFVTQINQEKQGAYGIYDYEIKVPVNLKNYIAAGSDVVFYWEITEIID